MTVVETWRQRRFNCIYVLIICPTTPNVKKETVITCLRLNLCSYFFFVSDIIEPDLFRKVKDKRPSAGSTAGQILPVISDKSSHVTQVQGSRQDQIGKERIVIFLTGVGLVGGRIICKKRR